MTSPVEMLDSSATLARAREVVHQRRVAEVEDLRVVAHWADLYGEASQPHLVVRRERGGDRLVRLGGEGTPRVAELALAELAVARATHVYALRSVTADVLDLQYRLPLTWDAVMRLHGEVWVARKVAVLSRQLPLAACAVLDVAVARMIGTEAPSRILTVAEAKVIEADPEAHRLRLEASRRRKFVILSRVSEDGLRTVIARVTAGDALWVDAVVDRVADLLVPLHAEVVTRDELRAEAFGFLARPAELLALLVEANQANQANQASQASEAESHQAEPAEPEEPAGPEEPAAPEEQGESRATAFPADLLEALRALKPTTWLPKVKLYIHLHQEAVRGTAATEAGAVARVEGVGPMLIEELAGLLAHTRVTVTPVLDLADRVSVNAYEVPEAIRERVLLQSPGEYFPYATSMTRHVDIDHVIPYHDTGPPDQTSTGNLGPLTRQRHRVKTYAGYQAVQSGLGEYLWRTPHGMYFMVDHTGTHPVPDHLGDLAFALHPTVDKAA